MRNGLQGSHSNTQDLNQTSELKNTLRKNQRGSQRLTKEDKKHASTSRAIKKKTQDVCEQVNGNNESVTQSCQAAAPVSQCLVEPRDVSSVAQMHL